MGRHYGQLAWVISFCLVLSLVPPAIGDEDYVKAATEFFQTPEMPKTCGWVEDGSPDETKVTNTVAVFAGQY